MWRSVIYKEWIKLKWVVLAFTVLSLLVLVNIILKVRHDIIFMEANNYLYSILFRGSSYFIMIKFVPLAIGIGTGIAQYFPETVNKRIKLTFHLPMNENETILKMHTFGSLVVITLFIVINIFFFFLSRIYLPMEVVTQALVTSLPWYLGGLAAYFMTSMILLEPVWLYRALYTVISYGFVASYYQKTVLGAYSLSIGLFALIAVIAGIVILFSAYRFRKGEM